MAKRVYELSKELNITNKDLLALLQKYGFELASHIAVVPTEAIEKIKNDLAQKSTSDIEKKKDINLNKTTNERSVAQKSKEVVVQQKKEVAEAIIHEKKPSSKSKHTMQQSKKQENANEKTVSTTAEPQNILLMPMTVSDFALAAKKPVSEVILALLKKGVVAAKNQMISEAIVEQLAIQYNIPVAQKPQPVAQEIAKQDRKIIAEGVQVERLPIVVVIGHVDHGKTTLLDFIRKTRVAAREKGGITQHLGAYEVKTDQGSLVFLDTPGHEAFSLMRVRGIKVADIAILVIAADDGVMPQTIEAIKAAKSIGLPIIVAMNKMDKANAQQVESLKRQLAQYDLVPEDWGGQTVTVPVSAKFGQGVSDLLDVVVLQAQLMELTANANVPGQGYVLESSIEKGRGSVATVILHNGTMQVGDYFSTGEKRGKISSLIDSYGKRLQQVGPSVPVQVTGFDELPQAGDTFDIVTREEHKKRIAPAHSVEQKPTLLQKSSDENSINLIIKADNASSKEAIIHAITKLSKKEHNNFNIVDAAVGSVKESDVILASDTGSTIYTFHMKPETNAIALAQRLKITIKQFDIIYKLLEDLEFIAEAAKPVKTVSKKIGEAVVLKVFDIKGLGVIAGAQVKTGLFNRAGKVIIYRGKHKVGEGNIKSLQRDKKTVKEVHAGFECAFLIDGFDNWLPEDRVECYLEVPAE